ncbi:MAG: hypothetical protein RLZZ399_388 [Verrucomicrobiota bacterium]|jgi:CheY-like chemotaxis protein
MKVVLCPNSIETESAVRKAVSPLGLTLECSLDVRYITEVIAASETPVLAILGINLSGVSGLSVCEELTAAETSRPVSVILVGTDNSVSAIAAAFAAGADDYLVLPMDSTLLAAHIGAAARRLIRFEHLPSHSKTTSSNRQQTMALPANPTKPVPLVPPVVSPSPTVRLSPSASKPPARFEPPAPVEPAAEESGEFDEASQRLSQNSMEARFMSIPTLREAKSHTLNGFKALHIPGVVELDRIKFTSSEPTMGAWSALLLPTKNLWLDVIVETDRKSADFLYRHLSGVKPVTSEDSASAMIQLVKTLKEQMQASFLSEGEEVILPILPRRVPAAELTNLSRFVVDRMRLAVGSTHIQVCVSYFASERAAIYKKIEELRSRDVTDEMIPLPEGNHPLLNRGVMLDDRKLNLLRNRFLYEESVGIRVFEPSAVSAVIQYS